jgi:hypothetical protein
MIAVALGILKLNSIIPTGPVEENRAIAGDIKIYRGTQTRFRVQLCAREQQRYDRDRPQETAVAGNKPESAH